MKNIGYIKSVTDYKSEEIVTKDGDNNIGKSPINAKRDVTINNSGYSLKSKRGSPPAVLNHTTREKLINVCNVLNLDINILDEMVEEYWNNILNKKIHKIDVQATSEKCPFGKTEEQKLFLKKLITFFMFDGTGTGKSDFPADYIIEFDDPEDIDSWQVFNKETAFDSMWPHFVFSLRKKGLPKDTKKITDEMKKWIRTYGTSKKGSLHIRCIKKKQIN